MNYKNKTSPWSWVPSLYFTEGLPYVLVMTVSVIMYKNLKISNADIAFYTSWLYVPWMIKPLWSPLVDVFKTKRWWILIMQLFIGAGLAGVALTLQLPQFFKYSLAFFWLLAFASATHDIAIDGFYMLGLSEKDQSLFVGIRSTFYRIAMLFGQGGLVFLGGYLENREVFGYTISSSGAWQITFFSVGMLFILFGLFHAFCLPKPEQPIELETKEHRENVVQEMNETIVSFFKKKDILLILGVVLTYRLGEAQLVKLVSPFFMDDITAGGLALSTKEIGIVYGTVGTMSLVFGGILGGVVASKYGLKKVFLPNMIALNIPNVFYIILAYFQISSPFIVSCMVAIEQFGYGFGSTAFMLYLMMASQGKHQTSHFALCTGFMAMGMMIPGMMSGWIQEQVGYTWFFVWVMVCTIPSFLLYRWIKIDPSYGKKKSVDSRS